MDFERIDKVDRKILEELKKDARMSYIDLSKKLKLSDVAVRKRMDKLLKGGIIKKFSIDLDYKKLDRPFHAFLLIKCSPSEAAEIRESLGKSDNILNIYPLLGSYDFLLELVCKDIDELKLLTEENIGTLRGVTEARTLVVV